MEKIISKREKVEDQEDDKDKQEGRGHRVWGAGWRGGIESRGGLQRVEGIR